MALQGTLDSFALPEVLRLLAATRKSGRLRLSGGRGTGNVWVSEGGVERIEAPHAPHATELVDALFELLRFEQGSFTFDADAAQESTGAAADLETLLAAAEELMVEWREIESVVPSMDAWVRLRRDLGSSKVSIERSHWTTIVAVGSGVTVRRMSGELCLAEMQVSRAVRDLFELGLVDIEASAPVTEALVSFDAPLHLSEIVDDSEVGDDGELRDDGGEAPLPIARPIRARRAKSGAHLAEPSEPEPFVPLELPGHNLVGSYQPSAVDPVSAVTAGTGESVDELAAAFPGLARRPIAGEPKPVLPGAPAALAAPAPVPLPDPAVVGQSDNTTPTGEVVEDADEGTEGEDQPMSRGVLGKLLSSVKS